jgi:hypothetical protein
LSTRPPHRNGRLCRRRRAGIISRGRLWPE